MYGDRLVGRTSPGSAPALLDAWVPLLALCADPSGPGLVGRCGRPGDAAGAADRRSRASAPVDGAADLLRDLVAIYDAGMSEPLPLPLKACSAWADAADPEAPGARRRSTSGPDRFPGEDADPEQVLVWGAGRPARRLLEQRPRPGEECDGEGTRLGALACRLWAADAGAGDAMSETRR